MIFAVKAIPNWMTIGRILATPVVAMLIWIDSPDFGYALALALFTCQLLPISLTVGSPDG